MRSKITENSDSPGIIPVVEEELVASKKVVKTGTVRVDKHVDYRTEIVSMPLIRHTVDIKRVAINREVDSIPEIRTVGATTIIPIVEEEIVVTKRLVLKEEVHMTPQYSKEIGTREVKLGTERAEVVRMDAEGRVIAPEGKPNPRRPIVRRQNL